MAVIDILVAGGIVSEPSQFGIASYKKDAIIAVEGRQKAEWFFIIQSGKVRLSKEIAIPGYEDELLAEGDIFGVVSAIAYRSHIQTAVAVTDVVLITVSPGSYENLIRKNGQAAMNILVLLSAKLNTISETLTANDGNGGEGSVSQEERFSRMFEVGEYYFAQKKYPRAYCVYTKYLKHCPDGPSSAAAKSRLNEMPDHAQWAGTDYKDGELNRTYIKDEIIFADGEPGKELFILQKGAVEVIKIVAGKEMLLGILKPGDIFGEMSLLNGNPRSSCTVAVEPCSVMAVNRASFMLLSGEQPQIVYKITNLVANRIWFNIRRIENDNVKDPLGRIYGILLIHLERDYVAFNSRDDYLFPVSWGELSLMLGFPEKESFVYMGALQKKDKNINILDGRIKVDSIPELVKAAEYYQHHGE